MTKIADLLNKAVAGELQATVQYIWQHVMIRGMTSPEVGELLRKTAIDEMCHFEKIAERIDYLGGVPTTQPEPIVQSRTNVKMVRDDIKAEESAIKLYKSTIEAALEAKDYTTGELFEEILAAEEGQHHAFLALLE